MPATVVNHVPLYYEEQGQSGDPLVLVHGSWVDHHSWDAVVPRFSESFRVLAYDRRGHSLSERSDRAYSLEGEAVDLACLIEERRLAPAHVVGTSSGGLVALRLAAQRPELIQSLVVNEPPAMYLLPEHLREAVGERVAAVVDALEHSDSEGAARTFVDTVVFEAGTWDQLPPEMKAMVIHNAPTFLDEMHDPGYFDLDLHALGAFAHPVLLTRGEKGIPFMDLILDRLAGAFPRARLHTFDGADHEPEFTRPDEFVTIVTGFVTATATSSWLQAQR